MEASSLKVVQLPDDMVIEILLRLPVKSLLCSKSVCKTWYYLIKTPTFISMHHKFNSKRSNSQLLLCSSHDKENPDMNNHLFSFISNHESATVSSPDFPILANTESFVSLVRNSWSGIVCYFDEQGAISLSNPATRQFKQLPPTSFQEYKVFYQLVVAFGFDSTISYDFKVLRLISRATRKGDTKRLTLREAYRAEIFTLSSNTWKQLHWGLDCNVQFAPDDGFFFAYTFHFIVLCHKSQLQTIACCDIHTERFTTMELPSTKKGVFTLLMVFKEFLSTVELNREQESKDIWIMKDYGVVESWTKLYSIRPPWGRGFPLCFWTVKDALLLKLDSKLVSVNLNTQTSESIEIQGYKMYSEIIVHQETLVSIM